ncbi:hypothetical protein LTR37_000099 [Vermiconidia calcicola]|uniref:Uncharacterized protein n=1 Tax=Vermiconidia calcicola TaxID=1690605 RepID=A0ACC3NZJ0_9PEZI|nr:hypothetical protein LTR37_000099 [Vermiconidia calcicola]
MATSSNNTTSMANAERPTRLPRMLRPKWHGLWDLQERALGYFDRDAEQWTDVQKRAWTGICKLFFLEGLKDVEFVWCHEYMEQQRNDGVLASQEEIGDRTIITVYTLHSQWQSLSDRAKWLKLLDLLLHECLHAYFDRFGDEGSQIRGNGHHSAWQILAEAIERRAWLHLGIRFYLGRAQSTILQYKELGVLGHTQQELNTCFGDRFEHCQDQDGQRSTFVKFWNFVPGYAGFEGYLHDPAVQDAIHNFSEEQGMLFEQSVERKLLSHITSTLSGLELDTATGMLRSPESYTPASKAGFWSMLGSRFQLPWNLSSQRHESTADAHPNRNAASGHNGGGAVAERYMLQ